MSTSHGSAQGQFASSCTSTRGGSLCALGGGYGTPALVTTPNDTVTIRIDDDVDSLSARLHRGVELRPKRIDARTYTFRAPTGVLLPRRLLVSVRYEGVEESGEFTWAVELRAPDTPTLSAARTRGRARIDAALRVR